MTEIDIHSERPGSILTPSQREHLLNLNDGPTKANQRMAKGRARKRLGAGIIDLSTILRYFPDNDLDKSFTQKFIDSGITQDVQESIADAIGVMYLGSVARPETHGIRGTGSVKHETGSISQPLLQTLSFENRAEEGIKRALIHRGVDVSNVEVSVDVETEGDLEIPDESLVELSWSRLEELRLTNQISQEEFISAVKEKEEKH